MNFDKCVIMKDSECGMCNYDVVTDLKSSSNSIEKSIYFSKLILLESFYCLGWDMLLTGVAYLMIDIQIYFVMSMLIYLLLNCLSFFWLSVKSWLLMSLTF